MIRPPINWSEVPTSTRPKLLIVRAPISASTTWTVLSDRDYGVFMHWIPSLKRNQPCTDPYGCPCQDNHALGTKWLTYLACQETRGGRVRLVEITSDAWIKVEGTKWLENRGSLRGLRLVLRREQHARTGRVIAELHDPAGADPDALPPSPNVKDELQRIWFSKLD